MGTTVVALLIGPGPTAIAGHVGDSRLYRLRAGLLQQITDDHSVVGELVRHGEITAEEGRVHPQSNEILRAIGTYAEVDIDIQELILHEGDRYLLCSDGLSGMLIEDEIAEALGDLEPTDACKRLIDMSNEAGGTDNITASIAWVKRITDTTASKHALEGQGFLGLSGRLWAMGILSALILIGWTLTCGGNPA